ncbi:MAG TPA: polysaccharide biosynthesis/export family protein [Steroidobacteraceae bacterium]|nr:polysaccharide biosynthesis/export family protein [Steroidobacteraceae bacterium]
MRQQRTLGGLWRTLLIIALGWIGVAPATLAQTTSASIAPGDVLKISVYGNPDLTTVTRVMPNGSITFPLIGQVTVGGATPAQAEVNIADRLSRGGFVRNAAVSIFVQERSPVAVSTVTLLGQVVRSGTYTLDRDSPEAVSTLVTLLAKAGGTTDKAADYCYLIRNENGQPRKTRVDLIDLLRNGNVKTNLPLANGDIVLVPEMDVFYIYGEVQKPGRYKLERDMTVMQGLSVASGMTPRGTVKGIVLNRLAGTTMTSLGTNLEDRLQPNDVLYVKTAVF